MATNDEPRKVIAERCEDCPFGNGITDEEWRGWCGLGAGFVLYDETPPMCCPLRERPVLVVLKS